MIAKHVPMRSIGKSDFAGLVRYISDKQGKTERLGNVQITNCQASSMSAVIAEVLATQHQNTRSENDKTFHLLISFRAGENPNEATLKAIEDRICAGLGYGEHQRVSAMHHDTDNLHIHIAINKIHPTRHTTHEPYQSYRTLGELCEVLERDYGLEQDNHESNRRISEGRASDMERHAGIESLISWIKRECLDDINNAQSWDELHQVMQNNGLELQARGNGLVVTSGDNVMIKASTLGRNFSKPKLEKSFGPFEPNQRQQAKPHRQYRKEPVRLHVNTSELYSRYKTEQQIAATNQKAALDMARRKKDRRINNAKKKGKARRTAIKLSGGGRITKKLLYAQASNSLKAEIDAIRKQHQIERQSIYGTYGRRTWADWLKQQALQGNKQALNALRARKSASGLKGNIIKGNGHTKLKHTPTPRIDNITKKGAIIFNTGASAVRDDGNRLQISRGVTQEGIKDALRLALARYGENITINGSPEFKARVIQIAATSKLPISFSDPNLEHRRQALMRSLSKSKLKKHHLGIGSINQPPPHRRKWLLNLSQIPAIHMAGNSAKDLPRPQDPIERRKARIRAEIDAKKAKRNIKGRTQ